MTDDDDTARVSSSSQGARKFRRETDTAVQSPDVLSNDGDAADTADTAKNQRRKPATTITASRAFPNPLNSSVPFGGTPGLAGGPVSGPVGSPSVSPVAGSVSAAASHGAIPSVLDLPDKTAALPSLADISGATTPYDSHADLDARGGAMPAREHTPIPRRFGSAGLGGPPGLGATARALHEEDEDGPTMVAPIPPEIANHVPSRPGPPPRDDEATQVHPARLPVQPITQPPPPISAPPLSLSPLSPISVHPRDPLPTAPPPVMAPSRSSAAVQATFDAASMMSAEAEVIQKRLARQYDTIAASLLGMGMVTATLASYLAADSEHAASYLGVVTLAAISLFLVGMGPLQQKNETKLSFVALGGVMLALTLIRLLMVALS